MSTVAENLSAHLDPAWGAKDAGLTALDGSAVYEDKHGALFTLRRFGENGNEIGRQPYQAPDKAKKHKET